MLYLVIKDNLILSCLDYKPNIPEDEDVKVISYKGKIPKEYLILIDGKICDSRSYIYSETEGKFIPKTEKIQEQNDINKSARRFLSGTDWKILRHIEQGHRNIPTSLTEKEYNQLLEERQKSRESIKD